MNKQSASLLTSMLLADAMSNTKHSKNDLPPELQAMMQEDKYFQNAHNKAHSQPKVSKRTKTSCIKGKSKKAAKRNMAKKSRMINRRTP